MTLSLVRGFNWFCTSLFEIVYWPLSVLGPFWSLTALSLLTGILMVWIFGRVSDQEAIKSIRQRMRANLLAIRLFNEDLALFFLLQVRIIVATLSYMKHSLLPLLVTIVPVTLILIQISYRYSFRPIREGERVLVKVSLVDESKLTEPVGISLTSGQGYAVETPGVRIPSQREINWRIRGQHSGRYHINIRVGDHSVEKALRVGNGNGGISNLRTGKSWFHLLMYPGETPIDKEQTGIESIEIQYPRLDILFLGWRLNWLIQYLVLSIIFGYLVSKPLGVEV